MQRQSLAELDSFFSQNRLAYEVVDEEGVGVVVEITSQIGAETKIKVSGLYLEDALSSYLRLQFFSFSGVLPVMMKYLENLAIFLGEREV